MHKPIELKVKEKLREKEELHRTIFENTGMATVIFEEDATISLANAKFAGLAGYTIDEIENKKKWTEFVVEEDLETMHRLHRIDPYVTPKSYEFRFIDRYGEIRNIFLNIDIISDTKQRIASLLDITENKRAEEALRLNEEKYRTVLEDIHEGYFEVDLAGNFTFFNDSLRRFLGYSQEILMGMNYRQYIDKKNAKELFQTFNKVYSTGKPTEGFDWQVIKKDGTKKYVEASVSLQKDSSGKPIGFRGIVRDVTERKITEEELKKTQLFNTAILDSIPGILYLYDDTGYLVQWNKQNEEVTGYSSEELKGMYVLDWFGSVEPDTSNIINNVANVMKNGYAMTEAHIITKSGQAIPMILTGVKLAIAGKDYLLGIGIDITKRKKAEEALKNSELKYRNIFENAIEGIYQSTREGKFITANAALARMAGYESPEELIESIKDIGTQLYVHPKDRKRFLEIRDAEGFVEGFEVEFYKKDRSKFWVVINARAVKDEQGEIIYIEGLIEDITIRKHAEEQLHQTLDRLKKAVRTTIGVLVSAVESRDPYTAGHQVRVAHLARAIATEMGLPQDKIDGIRLAGSIHDIGKLSIPAEILSKPTKLTNIEYSLIKEHSRVGYEMLKDFESPWPLAEIIYQHHECMNGSGYPRNLKRDDILIESQILAVADVVESMASHRPYRSALGIEAALEEIEKNKGILYDGLVADACLKLFREKGYQLT
ncbi:MAG: PAS domain S-box protein [Smithella sp.]